MTAAVKYEGHCGNPQCRYVWKLKVLRPKTCPKCKGTNIWIEEKA